MNILIISAALGALAGCTSTVWNHPTRGTATLQQDLEECKRRAMQEAMDHDPHTGNMLPVQEQVHQCLRAQGYIQRQRGDGGEGRR